ncbi:hypothetical protein B0H14DRAFT_2610955 [Mycena olivaceomarginata]|nr:hypothetical protein B0H14DRAFT_2610955 [Mycena olivaceomarginata]
MRRGPSPHEKVNETILKRPDTDDSDVPIPNGARAKVVNWNNDALILKVHAPLDFMYRTALFDSERDSSQRRNFVEVAPKKADIILRNPGTQITIERLTSTIRQCGFDTGFTLRSEDAAHLSSVVNGIAHFNYFLERGWGKRGCDDGSGQLTGFSIEMYRLQNQQPENGKRNMISIQGAEANFRAVKDAEYGFIIKNKSTQDLFPYLFYFNLINYTIECWYSSESKDVAPLKKDSGEVRVGMGGEAPFEFDLPSQKTNSEEREGWTGNASESHETRCGMRWW